jgi:predicted O-methyltransferase YrrM
MFGIKIPYKEKEIFVQLNEFDVDVIKEYASKANVYVEIGTAQGGSALMAREASKGEVYTIDDTDLGFEHDNINKILGDSLEVAKTWKKKIDVLFIDGDHTKAREDYNAWKKHMKKGGYILFHDYIPSGDNVTVQEDLEGIKDKVIFKPSKPVDTETRILIIQV